MPRQPHTILYLGLEAPLEKPGEKIFHLPVIRTVPRAPTLHDISKGFHELSQFTHIVFTSKTAVRIFFSYLPLFGYTHEDFPYLTCACVGKSTAKEWQKGGGNSPVFVPEEETAEGVCSLLGRIFTDSDYFFWPHSALSRPVIPDFFQGNHCRYQDCILYDTYSHRPKECPDLETIDEIVFTSPSTIDGFLGIYGSIPKNKILTTLGPITKKQLFLLLD